MARAMEKDAVLYRAVIKKSCVYQDGTTKVYYDYYGPYTSPSLCKQQATRLRKFYLDRAYVDYSTGRRHKVDVDLEAIERVSAWEVVPD